MPGSRALSTDVAVPLSKLSDVIVETQQDLKETGLYGNIVGYVVLMSSVPRANVSESNNAQTMYVQPRR